MANLADITLTNALAATTAAFWVRESEQNIKPMSMANFLQLLRTNNRVFTTETFKTGTNIFDQDVSDATEVSSLTFTASNEFIQMPSYAEYNLVGLNKRIIFTKEQVRLLASMLNSLSDESSNKKKKDALVRRNARNLRDKVMAVHFRKLFKNFDQRLVTSVSGSSCKSLESVINPSTGPSSSFGGTSTVDLTDLDVTINQPYWVKATGGTGDTGFGITLTGDSTMDYAALAKWISLMLEAQAARGKKYTHIICRPKVRQTLAHLAENRIVYTMDAKEGLEPYDPTKPPSKSGLHIQSYQSQLYVNGIPVVVDFNVGSDNYVWLVNIEELGVDIFEDRQGVEEFYPEDSALRDVESLARVYARMCATTKSDWGDDAIAFITTYFQMTYDCFSSVGLIVFDATSTT